MKHYSTEEFVGARKCEHWHSVIREVFATVNVKPRDLQAFQGSIDQVPLGAVELAQITTEASQVARSSEQASWSRERRYFLHLQTQGEMTITQDGRESVIREGDLTLYDSGMAYSLEYNQHSSALILIIDHNQLKRRIPAPEFILGRRIDGASDMVTVLSRSLQNIWELPKGNLTDDITGRIGENLCDLCVITCMSLFGEEILASATGSARRSHIRCHIEANLQEPDLSVSSIAKSFQISPRYLHMLFSDDTETVSELIRRRRLEEIKKRLGNPNWKNRTITQLAFEWGFNNTTHFARVFRERFGMSPREYRNANMHDGHASRDEAA